MSLTVTLYRFLRRTQAEGPGLRACLWVQGCSLACAGCFNTHLWPQGGRKVAAAELLERILDSPGIEGVTFLGGEPFEQADALAWLAARVRREGLSVMSFSGYTIEELWDRGSGTQALLAETDLLVDGRYVASRPDTVRPWVGSTNQRLHFLSHRYVHLKQGLETIRDRLEIRIEPGGSVFINGMADKAALAAVRRAAKVAGGAG